MVNGIHHRTGRLCYVALFLLLCLLMAPYVGEAASQSSPAQLKKLTQEYQTLLNDAKKSGLRHHWERMDRQFIRLAKQSSGDTKVTALFYSARSKHTLAEKSFGGADFKAASKAYLDLVSAFPKHSLASESLYRVAAIEGVNLKNTEEGKRLINRLTAEYPKSSQAGKAKALLARMDSVAGSKSSSQAKSGRAPSGGGGSRSAQVSTADRAKQLGLTVKTIMIDPGHGGKDPGTEGNGIRERDVTLAFAKILGKELQRAGYTVLYTRSNNTFLALNKRTEMANAKKADLFISIHINSNKNTSINGLETYYLDEANSDSAKKVAARENSVSMSKVSDVQFILTDLMLNSKLKESRALARAVHSNILRELRTKKIGFRDNKVRPAPFYVLMGARMPSVLIELGYASNRNDAKNLKNTAFLNHQARGIVRGIAAYKQELAKIIN